MSILEPQETRSVTAREWKRYSNRYYYRVSSAANGWVIWDTSYGAYCTLPTRNNPAELLVFERGVDMLHWLQLMAARGCDMKGRLNGTYPPYEDD